jgi:hypothetical protein
MRQKDDEQFYNLLNRIRVGVPTNEDIDSLKKNLIGIVDKTTKVEEAAQFYVNKISDEPEMVCLLPTIEQTNKFNYEVTKLLKIDTIIINAEDANVKTFKKRTTSTTKRLKKKKSKDTAGLEDCIEIGINSSGMLRKNIILEKGLVNGALGYITKINK